MRSQDWDALVAVGRRLAETSPDDRWALGDLALQAVQAGETRADKAQAQQDLLAFATEIGVSHSRIKDCWYTSAAWPPGSRFLDESHAKHSKFRNRPNRISLLLNDVDDDGLSSARLREQVHKAEEILADKAVRQAILSRSDARSRRIREAARALENEEDLQARLWAKAQQEQAKAELAAPHILAGMAERAIKANNGMARMTGDLLDLRQVIKQLPDAYRDRTIASLQQVIQAASRSLHELQPDLREPQLRNVIDHDDTPGDRESE
jgi:hypothetical protein